MRTTELVSELRKQNITLRADSGQLMLSGPKGALTPEMRAELLGRKEEILNFLNYIASSSVSNTPPLQSVVRDRTLPLSFAQQRLWFLDQYEPNSSVYNIPSALRLRGYLNIGVLEQSLNEIIRRHENLRTTFSLVDGEPVQLVAPSVSVSVPVVDLGDYPESEREEKARGFAKEEARRPFDLTRDPLFRVSLIRLGEVDHILVLTMHHIVSDGWSMGILYRELSVLYGAFSQDKPSPLPDSSIQYADFAIWQREWLTGEVLDRQLSYWKKQLEGIPAVLNLPTDRPRPAVQSYRGGYQSFELTKELTQSLKALSRKEGVTLFMTLLAAFQTLLHRYAGQEDIVVGSPIANRNRSEIEGLIGFFVNTLVLRTNFNGDPTFKELLARVRETALGAYAHQDLPFERLVEELQPQRSLSHSPLLQVMFVLQNVPRTTLSFEGLSASPVRIEVETAKFDLTLSMSETGEGLSGSIEYNADLFDETTIDRLLGHFQILLEGIIGNPEQQISKLRLMTQAEQHQLLTEWNDTEKEYPKDKCIHELFEEQVEKNPDAVAALFENQQLTYRELNSRANQLAHYLRKLEVGPERLVGICVDRSLETMIGLLGILKAGGAYVPLDPEYPKERLAFILNDAQVAVLLTQHRLVDGLAAHSAHVVCLERDWEQIAAETDKNPISCTVAENLAYVVYTSGSTGQPKGVEVRHQGVLRLLIGVDYVRLDSQQRFLQLAPTSFDASTFEIWGALLCGARCVLFPGKLPSPSELGNILRQYDVSTLWLTASLFNTVIDEAPEALSGVGQLLIGGEALSVPHVRRALALLPHTQIVNGYGPTESTTFTCCYPIPDQFDETMGSIPIGGPIANTEVYLLDSQLSPVPIGVAGELYIGGDGLARGYLNRPELTAEKFIAHPFTREPGARLYKTGDVARYLTDGNIEFLGRKDHQVKVRGYRIEVGEIESALSQHPGVRDAVVLARTDDPLGDPSTGKRLVAYVVPRREPAPTVSELKSFLKEKLPQYMIPSAFVLLDSLPLTLNGKVDRKALPVPDQNRPQPEESYVAPRTPVEEMIAEIWAQVLKLDRVGVHDNFFDLGGHSLLATQAMSRTSQVLQVELPLRALFEGPTVAELVKRIEEARGEEQSLARGPIVPVARDQDMPLSFAQQRLWFLDQLMPGSIAYNMSGAVRLSGPLNIVALERSFTEILRRHEILRTTFRTVNGQPFQSIAPAKPFILPVKDLEHIPEAEREAETRRLATEEARRTFDLAKGPLFRATLFRLGEEEHILQCAMHHGVSDGWSMAIFNREMGSLYHSFSTGQPSTLPELPIQYADFAQWQRQWLQGEVLETQLSYWKKQLASAPPSLELPTDGPRPSVQAFHGAHQFLVLPNSLTKALKALSRQEGVTLFMILLAAFKVLLYRYTGQEDIVVGIPIAGRNRAEIEPLIGFFINTVALRTDLSGDPSFRELLRRVRQVALGAYDHQELPFEKLVEELQPERDLSHTPLFQVFFNMLNLESLESHRPELAGLTTEPLLFFESDSKFDLTFYARESNEEIHLTLVYNAALFCQDRMVEAQEQFKHLLNQIADNADKKIAQLSLITRGAKAVLPNPAQQLRTEWLGAIHTRFAQQAIRFPEQIAVLSEQDVWSYGELESRSNQLANYLIACGVQSGEIVAIYARRSAALVWALLGILKAGGSFLVLDPSYPTERLRNYVRVAKPTAWIMLDGMETSIDIFADVISTLPCRCRLALSQSKTVPDHDPTRSYPDSDPGLSTGPDDRAYVVFTSGTSGKPKAIEGTHRPLSHFLEWHCQAFSLKKTDRFSMLSGLSHDPLLRDVFTPLWLGATLCIPDLENTSPGELVDWLKRDEVSVVHLTPSMSEVLVRGLAAGGGSTSLRYVFFGGDILTELHMDRIRNLATGATCVNFYGATETPQAMSYFLVPERNDHSHTAIGNSKRLIPLGRGIEGAQLLVLNCGREMAGVGELGEICVRSPYLAKGYMGDEELTHARFLTNPFTGASEDRLYTTGDLGRYRSNGDVEFAGRADHQVKIRGFRIEPEEIEVVLGRHPSVKDATVVAREDTPDERRLVAYLVAGEGATPATRELRSFLKSELPDYMVPAVFVVLDALPLTPNGKVDRKALPAPDSSRPDLKDRMMAPRTPTEAMLAGIWAKLLGVNGVGIRDNFFDLGGHSLLAVRLFAEIEKAFKKRPPLSGLFQEPTIEHLAALFDQENPTTTLPSLVAIQPEGSKLPFFCVHEFFGDVFCYLNLARHLGQDQPFYALQPRGLEGGEEPFDNVEAMAAYYIDTIKTVQPHGPYALGGLCFGGVIAFEMARQLCSQGEPVSLVALLDSGINSGHNNASRSWPLFETVKGLPSWLIGALELNGSQWRDLLRIKHRMFRSKVSSRNGNSQSSKLIDEMADLFGFSERHRKVARAQQQAMRSYRPSVYPGRLTLFRARMQPLFSSHRPDKGWSRLAGGGLDIRAVPGNHLGMLQEPHVQILAQELTACLEEANIGSVLEQGSASKAASPVFSER